MSTTFADRLNRLFATLYPPGRGPFTSAEVLAALVSWGHPVSAGYLSQLRSGARHRPSPAITDALASFFRVPPEFFTDDETYERLNNDLLVLEAVRQPEARRIAQRCHALSPQSRQAVLASIEELRHREDLDD
ncbi:MAG TPA: transcriptional regulator [Mycobacterium sp.]|nr:transcriptional regulator [Mycobacterium sp.]